MEELAPSIYGRWRSSHLPYMAGGRVAALCGGRGRTYHIWQVEEDEIAELHEGKSPAGKRGSHHGWRFRLSLFPRKKKGRPSGGDEGGAVAAAAE